MKKKTQKRKAPEYGLRAQIEFAQRSIKSWPKWMKDNAYFAGSNLKDNR